MARLLWIERKSFGPAPRAGAVMTYDQGRKRTILFGQGSLAPDSSDTWLWDGEGWIQVADIGPRSGAAKFVIYDPIRDKIVLFGGGTWEWDGTNWVQVASQVIGPLSYARGAWDSKRQRMVAVTELAHGACLTWEWNGAEWAQVSEEGPPWRYGFDVAYDDERQKLILFGGNTALLRGWKTILEIPGHGMGLHGSKSRILGRCRGPNI